MARISKGDFGKRHCNTEMSTVIPIDLKRALGHFFAECVRFFNIEKVQSHWNARFLFRNFA